MGAGFSLNIKCPEPFVSLDALSCVMPCPADKKFIRKGTNGEYKCVYAPDEQYSVDLVTVGSVPFDGTTLEQLRAVNSQKYTEFSTEKDRFEKALITVYANIDKQQKINDAFKDLQAAENARDQSPSAYQAARTAYYTLVKGTGWLNEEKERIAKAEVDPEIQKYRDAVAAVNVRKQEQQKTLDVVNGIKDKVLSLRDDFKYSVNTFSDQIEKVKVQIAMENRTREKETDTTSAWINTILNVLLVAVLAYAAYVLVRKVLFPQRFVQPAVSVYTRPAYTA
jgi:hypothetical protein